MRETPREVAIADGSLAGAWHERDTAALARLLVGGNGGRGRRVGGRASPLSLTPPA
jgi:hypothetical protein